MRQAQTVDGSFRLSSQLHKMQPRRQLEMWSGERLDKDLGVSHREVRVEAVG